MPQTLAEEILSFEDGGPYVECDVYATRGLGDAESEAEYEALVDLAEDGHEAAHVALTGG